MRVVDSEQRERALDPTLSFCVSAPAGSGKTELLTQRVLTLLARVEQPEQVLAITFTRKAAAEMRERILGALALGNQAEPSDQPHRQLTWALARDVLERDRELGWSLLQNPARLRVQTIDSLCQSIAQDQPVVSRFGAPLRALDDARPLYEQAVDSLFLELEGSNDVRELLSAVLAHLDNDLARLRKLLVAMLPMREQWLRHVVGYRDPEATRQALEAVLQRWVSEELLQLRSRLEPYAMQLLPLARFAAEQLASDKPTHPITALAELVALPAADDSCADQWLGIAELLLTRTANGGFRARVDKNTGFPAKGAARDEAHAAMLVEQKAAMQSLLSTLTDDAALLQSLQLSRELPFTGLAEQQWSALVPLAQCLVRCCAHLTAVFGQTGRCDHAEVAAAALRALADGEGDTAFRYDQALRHVLVDEFQDTSAQQYALLELLVGDWAQQNALAEAPPRTLFIVGDAMQSIYGFREAKVGLFLQAAARGVAGLPMTSIALQQNFRSRDSLVDWINDSFASVFPTAVDLSRGAVPYAPSVGRAADADERPAVEAVLCAEESGHETEAGHIVNWIRAEQRSQPDASIAVLVRYRSHLPEILTALDAAGIRWQGNEISRLDERETISDCLALVRALFNPADQWAWVAVLRAPWCGLGMLALHEMLASLCRIEHIDSLSQAFQLTIDWCLEPPQSDRAGQAIEQAIDGIAGEEAQRLRDFGTRIRTIWAARSLQSVRRWLEAGWRHLGGEVLAANTLAGDEREVARQFFDLIERLEQDSVGSGQFFTLEELERAVEKLYGAAPVDAGNNDSAPPVQIMTIHKAKGLEFDAVIVPGLNRGSPPDDKPLLAWGERLFEDGSTGTLMCPLDARLPTSQAVQTPANSLYDFLRSERQRSQTYEQDRVLYVACTRARNRLLLIGTVKPPDDDAIKPWRSSFLASLWPCVEQQVSLLEPSPETEAEADDAPMYVLQRRLADPRALYAKLDAEQPALRSATATEADPNTATQARGAIFQPPAAAQLLGTIAHELLEQCIDAGTTDWLTTQGDAPLRWRQRLQQLGMASGDIEAALESLATLADRLSASEHFSWCLDPSHLAVRTEWRLAHAASTTGEARADTSLLILDLFIVDASGQYWVIDYKTAIPAEHETLPQFLASQRALYGGQLANYAAAVSAWRATQGQLPGAVQGNGQPPECVLYFPLIDHWEPVETG